MPLECPVCHEPVSRLRAITRTAFSRWRCPGCGSLLGVSLARRLLAGLPWAAIVILVFTQFGYTGSNLVVTVPLLIVLGFATFTTFEKIVVFERCGLRCRSCGYDLQGQVEPHCPECGVELSADDVERLERLQGGDDPERTGRGRPRRRWVAALLIILLLLAVLLQGVFVLRTRTRTAPPPASSQPAETAEVPAT